VCCWSLVITDYFCILYLLAVGGGSSSSRSRSACGTKPVVFWNLCQWRLATERMASVLAPAATAQQHMIVAIIALACHAMDLVELIAPAGRQFCE
jgi:hypothetical protein